MKNKNLQEIEKNVCYTNLVYQRINKKLKTNYSKKQIEHLIKQIIRDDTRLTRKGKTITYMVIHIKLG